MIRISTTAPITLNDVTDMENSAFVIEGQREGAIKVYSETEQNQDMYLAIGLHGSGDLSGLKWIFDAMAENPHTGSIN